MVLEIVLFRFSAFSTLGCSNLLHGKPIPEDWWIFLACLNRIFAEKQRIKSTWYTEIWLGDRLPSTWFGLDFCWRDACQ
jgi:hypothetical protein